MRYSWAQPYPELYKICVLFERTDLCYIKTCVYKSLKTYLQNGPQCGLVALAMIMGDPTMENVNHIFDYSKLNNYTYNGEIFSVEYMFHIVKHFLPNSNIELYSGQLDSSKIRDFLLSGGLLLVPYDTNKDNSPGLHNGHKAHWCAISGVIETSDGFFVTAKHGKAKNVSIWKLGDLSKSNQQLLEFSPDRKLQDIEYKLPNGGINGPQGLNNRCVLISMIKP